MQVPVAVLQAQEGGRPDDTGITACYVCQEETGSDLALAAARRALAQADKPGAAMDVVIDYSVLPQEYLVPAWNMSGKIQHEVGATKSFTLGFSGGGATNFLVALQAAHALLTTDAAVQHALLVAADVALPGNRLLPPERPVTVLGDGASAVVLCRDGAGPRVLDVQLHTDGALHDVCYIPGGAIVHADAPEQYRMVLDRARYDAAPRHATLRGLSDAVLAAHGLHPAQVARLVLPGYAVGEQAACAAVLGFRPEQVLPFAPVGGHVQGTDLVRGLVAALADIPSGGYVLLASEGMGYQYGAALLAC
jgi:3-oxoacyl-[acyl-carrier-protein] synthase-3